MKSKKAKKKSKTETKKNDKEQISEVDKTFYELQIADLNRKLERLTHLSVELEQRNSSLNSTYEQLDEDRADVIAFLQRTLQTECDEVVDLVARLEGLNATRQTENEDFAQKLKTKDEDFIKMQTQLNSDIMLLEGKLNSLEEFRLQKDELMKKYEQQEAAFKQQEKEHGEKLYSIERKFIVDKDTLVKHMEQKLMQLSDDFQNITDMRIAESSQRMIRENIAVNNENVQLVQEQKDLYRDNDELLAKCRHLRLQKELAETEFKASLDKVNVQKGLINELTDKYEQLQKDLDCYQLLNVKLKQYEDKINKYKSRIDNLYEDINTLQSNVKDCRAQRKILLEQLTQANEKSSFLTKSLFESVFNLKHMIRLRNKIPEEDIIAQRHVEEEIMQHRDAILNELYNMFLNAKEAERECKDLETWVQFYRTGCVGFIPKGLQQYSEKEKNVETHMGVSFEEFLRIQDGGVGATHLIKSKIKGSCESVASGDSLGSTTIASGSDFCED